MLMRLHRSFFHGLLMLDISFRYVLSFDVLPAIDYLRLLPAAPLMLSSPPSLFHHLLFHWCFTSCCWYYGAAFHALFADFICCPRFSYCYARYLLPLCWWLFRVLPSGFRCLFHIAMFWCWFFSLTRPLFTLRHDFTFACYATPCFRRWRSRARRQWCLMLCAVVVACFAHDICLIYFSPRDSAWCHACFVSMNMSPDVRLPDTLCLSLIWRYAYGAICLSPLDAPAPVRWDMLCHGIFAFDSYAHIALLFAYFIHVRHVCSTIFRLFRDVAIAFYARLLPCFALSCCFSCFALRLFVCYAWLYTMIFILLIFMFRHAIVRALASVFYDALMLLVIMFFCAYFMFAYVDAILSPLIICRYFVYFTFALFAPRYSASMPCYATPLFFTHAQQICLFPCRTLLMLFHHRYTPLFARAIAMLLLFFFFSPRRQHAIMLDFFAWCLRFFIFIVAVWCAASARASARYERVFAILWWRYFFMRAKERRYAFVVLRQHVGAMPCLYDTLCCHAIAPPRLLMLPCHACATLPPAFMLMLLFFATIVFFLLDVIWCFIMRHAMLLRTRTRSLFSFAYDAICCYACRFIFILCYAADVAHCRPRCHERWSRWCLFSFLPRERGALRCYDAALLKRWFSSRECRRYTMSPRWCLPRLLWLRYSSPLRLFDITPMAMREACRVPAA